MGTAKSQLSRVRESDLYLEVQADLGITKHMGGLAATEELAALCRIDHTKLLLDIGCGAGKTPCYMAKRHKCRVVGADISGRMIATARERMRREDLGDKVQFALADARNLPFDDCAFDAVIGESVAAFVTDRDRAVEEYVRVTKPGGYVGLNEVTWIKPSPPKELMEYVSRTTGARPEPPGVWEESLLGCGLKEVEVRPHPVSLLSEWVDEVRWLDFRDFLAPWLRLLSRYLTNPGYRRFVGTIRPVPGDYFEYFGYGVYVGRK